MTTHGREGCKGRHISQKHEGTCYIAPERLGLREGKAILYSSYSVPVFKPQGTRDVYRLVCHTSQRLEKRHCGWTKMLCSIAKAAPIALNEPRFLMIVGLVFTVWWIWIFARNKHLTPSDT